MEPAFRHSVRRSDIPIPFECEHLFEPLFGVLQVKSWHVLENNTRTGIQSTVKMSRSRGSRISNMSSV
jgi:hypothetical protein